MSSKELYEMEDFCRQKHGGTWKVLSKRKERIVLGEVTFIWMEVYQAD